MLLKLYEPVDGEIFFNHLKINEISPMDLRKNCGVVMQDGFIFSDTIERNIATNDEKINRGVNLVTYFNLFITNVFRFHKSFNDSMKDSLLMN